jgi:hypothetical protein
LAHELISEIAEHIGDKQIKDNKDASRLREFPL